MNCGSLLLDVDIITYYCCMLIGSLDVVVEWCLLFVNIILIHWKLAHLSTSNFLAGCHYNEEEISQHLKKNVKYYPVQINDNKFATGQILKKPVEGVKEWILAG